VPAYIRHSMKLNMNDIQKTGKEPSQFTLSTDENGDGPVFRENNAYLNDNVD